MDGPKNGLMDGPKGGVNPSSLKMKPAIEPFQKQAWVGLGPFKLGLGLKQASGLKLIEDP